MVSVKSVVDKELSCVIRQESKSPVCIVLCTGCEDHDLIELCHLSEELDGIGPDEYCVLFLDEMDKGLIQIKHEGVLFAHLLLERWQVWDLDLGVHWDSFHSLLLSRVLVTVTDLLLVH